MTEFLVLDMSATDCFPTSFSSPVRVGFVNSKSPLDIVDQVHKFTEIQDSVSHEQTASFAAGTYPLCTPDRSEQNPAGPAQQE